MSVQGAPQESYCLVRHTRDRHHRDLLAFVNREQGGTVAPTDTRSEVLIGKGMRAEFPTDCSAGCLMLDARWNKGLCVHGMIVGSKAQTCSLAALSVGTNCWSEHVLGWRSLIFQPSYVCMKRRKLGATRAWKIKTL